MVAVEIEGGIWSRGRHVRPKGYEGDVEKYNEATLLGWKLIRVTPKMVRNGKAIEYIKRVINDKRENKRMENPKAISRGISKIAKNDGEATEENYGQS